MNPPAIPGRLNKSEREIMRCLKRYIAREIYRALQNPRPIPQTEDLRLRRLALHITLTSAAQHFGLWPSGISRIEQGKTTTSPTAAENGSLNKTSLPLDTQ